MILCYTVAVGDEYVRLAYKTLSITRRTNPYLPLMLFYADVTLKEWVTRLTLDLDVKCVQVKCSEDRWGINFLKWEVPLPENFEHYLYIDADACLVGPLTRSKVLEDCKAPICAAPHPQMAYLLSRDRPKIWTHNEPAAYYVPLHERKIYCNAGVVLMTFSGMRRLQFEMGRLKEEDCRTGWYQTSPYFDETYFNRLIHNSEFAKHFHTLPPEWNRFSRLYRNGFSICHLVAHGAGLPKPFAVLEQIIKQLRLTSVSFKERFFPTDYFRTGWLMETVDRFALLGLLTQLRLQHVLWIGVYGGKDLEVIRRTFPNLKITAVDLNTKHLNPTSMDEGWINFFEGDSSTLIPQLIADNSDVNGIYIDGDHSYEGVKKDLSVALQFTDKVVFGHDWHHPPLKQAVEEIRKEVAFDFDFDVISTPPTEIFESTYGGFYIFTPKVTNGN